MTRKFFYFVALFFLNFQLATANEPLGLYTDVTFASRSIWHGWDIADNNNPVIHPCIEYSIGQTGFSVAFWASIPIDRSLKAADDLEFLLKYGHKFFKESPLEMSFNAFGDYIICPSVDLPKLDGTEQTKMLWKYNGGVSLTNLVKIADSPVVPGYNFFHIRPYGDIDFKSGSVHELSLYYTIPVLSKIKVGGTANYHTGVFGGGKGWTHATTQVSTSVKAGPVNIAGALNYQWSFDKREDIVDECWVTIGVNKSF